MGSVRVPDRFQEVWPKEWRENIFPLTFPDESQPPSEVSLVPLSNWALTPIQVRSFKAWLRKVPWICFRSESWVVKQNPHLNGKGNRRKIEGSGGPQTGLYFWLVEIPAFIPPILKESSQILIRVRTCSSCPPISAVTDAMTDLDCFATVYTCWIHA